MKITCQNKDFEKDMQDLVNLFYEENDTPFSIQHFDTEIDDTLTSKIVIDDGEKQKEYIKFYTIQKNLPPLRLKSVMKGHVKNHLYTVLSSITKKTLPWGSLTGVRPAKFAREMVDRKEIKEYLVTEILMRDFYVQEKKAKLVTEILKNQKCIIKNDKLLDLFINIPICPTRCNYCSFISSELCTVADKVESYLDCLLKELRAVKELINDKM